MGIFFCLNRITCNECKQLGQNPEWFTKNEIYQNITLINEINYITRYDKYGNEITTNREKTEYCCSFGHTFVI
jgi:hypothetical protein